MVCGGHFCSNPFIGILGIGILANFCLSNPFPNKTIFPLTLDISFYIPFFRDILLLLGLCSVKKSSIHELIHLKKSMIVMLGGAREVLLSKPFNPTIILTPRKGIFRIALKHKIPVVPVFTFGEMEAWETRPFPPWLHFVQKITKRLIGVMPVLFWPPIPRRIPLVTVVGEPIYAEHVEDTDENILFFQEKFRTSLLKLYNLHYQRFNYSQLTII
jgi:2-acylglycerol O-acyltransferase 2